MKKLLSIILVILVLTTLLASCGTPVNTNTETDTNTESNVNTDNTNTDTSTDSNINTDNANTDLNDNTNIDNVEPILCEKYGNNVYFTFEEKENNYYPVIKNYKETETSIEFPKDYDKSYMKIISTYEELSTYISSSTINKTMFKTNYVICLKMSFCGGSSWLEDCFKSLGYYSLQLNNEKYEISLDFYYSSKEGEFVDEAMYIADTAYLIVPKNEINFVEGIHEIVVNENPINGEHNGMSSLTQIGDTTPPFTNTHWFVSYEGNAILPNKASSWVVKTGSGLEKEIGINSSDDYEYRMILYLPNEPTCDFVITEKEIKDGNLYLTAEAYTQHENEYMIKNDVKFYDLYIKDTSLLNKNYNVYITVKKVNASVGREIIDKAEAIMIAQEHFFNTYYENLNNECYYAKEVYSLLDNEDKVIFIPNVENFNFEDVRYIVHIYPGETDSDVQLSRYIYYISKTGLILYDVKE